MADVAKRLAFEDLSLTLRLSDVAPGSDSFDDVRNKISSLASAYDQHCKKAEQALNESRNDALKLVGPGGLAAKALVMKRQMQSLKSSLLNLGQKELFSEAILTFNEMQDYKAEADRCASAVEAAEEDLKDLKKENQQDEEHLNEAIRMIETYHEQHQQVMARIAQRLSAAAKELAAVDVKSTNNGSSAPSPPPTPVGVNGEEELDAMLAQQGVLATSLESQLARHEAGCQDLEGDLSAHEAEIRRMEAEIAQIEAMKEDESKQAKERHAQNIAWCDALIELVARVTGVSIESIEEDSISLRISLPSSGPHAPPSQGPGLVLRAMMEPGTTHVCAASASPASAVPGLPALVAFVKGSGGGLPLLLTLVKSKVFSEAMKNTNKA